MGGTKKIALLLRVEGTGRGPKSKGRLAGGTEWTITSQGSQFGISDESIFGESVIGKKRGEH